MLTLDSIISTIGILKRLRAKANARLFVRQLVEIKFDGNGQGIEFRESGVGKGGELKVTQVEVSSGIYMFLRKRTLAYSPSFDYGVLRKIMK